MEAITPIRRLHEHRFWSNARLREIVRDLSPDQQAEQFEIGQGSIMATMTHLYAAEFVWLAALEGEGHPPSPFTFAFTSFAALEAAWDELDARWQWFLEHLQPAMLTTMVTKRSTSSMAGRTVATPMVDVLLHVCTHAQYTTAQAANMLRHLGVDVPDTMLVTLSRQQHI